jgi:outer membrane protein TolC
MKLWRSLCLPLTLFAVASCTTVGPDFEAPETTLPSSWDGEASAESMERAAYWWRLFDDPLLDELVSAAASQNLDLQAAGLRIIQARAALGIADALRFPQQQALSGSLIRTYQEDNAYNSANLNFDVAWEMDVWGKYARGIESSQAGLYGTIASYDDILISITAEVARNYINYRTSQERIMLAQQNIEIQRRVVEITEIQFESGNVTELDVQQARTQLYSTESTLPALRISMLQARNAIAVLLGRLPQQVNDILERDSASNEQLYQARLDPDTGILAQGNVAEEYDDYSIVPATPVLQPRIDAALVARRPDIQVAELSARAQSARIGLAEAELYPQFFLVGSIGVSQTVLSDEAFSGTDAVNLSLGPGFSWNIFNYGRIKNQVRVEDARFQESLSNYNQTVLRAVQEVSNALNGYNYSLMQRQFRFATVQASIRAFRISMIQYQDGLVSYQRLLSTVEKMTRNEDLYAQTKGSIANQVVALYKALGGGWQMRSGQPFVSEEIKQQMRARSNWGKYLEPEAANASEVALP